MTAEQLDTARRYGTIAADGWVRRYGSTDWQTLGAAPSGPKVFSATTVSLAPRGWASRVRPWALALVVLPVAAIGSYRNDFLRGAARQAGFEAQYLAAEARWLGTPGYGTPRSVEAFLERFDDQTGLLAAPSLRQDEPRRELESVPRGQQARASRPAADVGPGATASTTDGAPAPSGDAEAISLDALPLLPAEQTRMARSQELSRAASAHTPATPAKPSVSATRALTPAAAAKQVQKPVATRPAPPAKPVPPQKPVKPKDPLKAAIHDAIFK